MANSELILKFKNEQEKKEWMTWYLDGGGEDFSEFYVMSWDELVFHLENDEPEKSGEVITWYWKDKIN